MYEHKESLTRLQDILGSAKTEMRLSFTERCDTCIAVDLLRAKKLLDSMYEDYKEYLD